MELARKFSASENNIANLLLHYFGGNPYFAQARLTNSDLSYTPIKQPLTEDMLQDHLDGAVTLGAYQIQKEEGTVRWLGWDVDSRDLKVARELTRSIVDYLQGIPYAVEYSGSKGYHILIFLSDPMPAPKAKQIVDHVRNALGLAKTGATHVECYPKQDKLTAALPMGSLLKIPLGQHPRTHNYSMFIDINNGWENGEPISPAMVLTNPAAPETLTILMSGKVDVHKQLVELLTPQWEAAAGEHHNFALYLAGYLCHIGWGLDEAKMLVHEIAMGAKDQEVNNRVQAVIDTYRNVSDNRSVKGYSGLSDMLPGSIMSALSLLAAQVVTPTLVKRIDGIRLAKGASFEKVRQTAAIIWSDLKEGGEIVQTAAHVAYWFNSEEHLLVPLDSVMWQATLHSRYGINAAEAFGTQVTNEIRLRAIAEGRIVSVKYRTVWNGEKLFVNLGNSEVYILDGNEISRSYNGECGYLFRTDVEQTQPIVPDFSRPVDVWNSVVKDISFNKSADAPATPEEQAELLKAWIISSFFMELMPTKPLLLALGDPGSGKTTALRRILRVLESPDSEVLEVATDKPDSLRSSIANHRILVLDNLEKTGARWLIDALNRLATGAAIEIRELYKTNAVYAIRPECFVAMTAVSMPFSDETLFSRILPLSMSALESPLPEYLLQKRMREDIAGIWADLLLKLNMVVGAILRTANVTTPPIASRLADFTVLCKRIETSGVVNGATLLRGLRSLVDRQKVALLESSPFITVLEEWLNTRPEDAARWHTFTELFQALEPMAHIRKLTWRWSNSQSLGRHVIAMADPLKRLYRAEIATREDSKGKMVEQIKFPAQ